MRVEIIQLLLTTSVSSQLSNCYFSRLVITVCFCWLFGLPPLLLLVKLGEVFMDEVDLHKKCDDEYSQLKEEFERYKLRAQSVLKNKSHRVCNYMYV